MSKMRIVLMILLIFSAPPLAADDAPIARIRQAYAETAAAIALGQKGEAGGFYCNQLAFNNFNGSWRAVGNYSQTVLFWYSDQPEFAAAAGAKPEAVLAKVEVRETAAAVSSYREFFFTDGRLAFFFRKEKAGDGPTSEERIYFQGDRPLLRPGKGESDPETGAAATIIRAAAHWQKLFLLSFGAAAPLPAVTAGATAGHPVDAWLAACMAKDPSTQGVNLCLGQAYEKWDAELNRVYRELGARLAEGLRPSLREAQRAWVAFRDGELAWLAKFYGSLDGSMYRSMLAADRLEVVRKRVLELNSSLDVLEQE
jgi:uncharacterized protein YecT (DUF1311 family)